MKVIKNIVILIRTILVILIFLLGMYSMVAAETHILRLSLLVSEDHPQTIGARYFEKRLEEKSEGRIEVEVFPNAILGDEYETWEGIQQGTIDMQVTSSIGSFIPEFQFFNLPYLWANESHWDAVMTTENVVTNLMKELLLEKGVVYLGSFTGGSRHLITTTDKPVRNLDDLRGISMRIWPDPVVMETWTLLGTNPTEISFGETYVALQTGVVKAAENSLATFLKQSWVEPAKYLILTGHDIGVRQLIIGKSQLEKLPEDLQKIVLEVGAEAAEYQVKIAREQEQEILNKIKNMGGIEIIELEDKEKWIEKTNSIRESFANNYNMVDILEYIKETSKDFIK